MTKVHKYSLVEFLADLAHRMWSGWMVYLFRFGDFHDDGSFTIDADKVARWRRQIATPYDMLPSDEQESDKAEARRMVVWFSAWIGNQK